MDRYWHSTAAYALAQSIADSGNHMPLPDKSDSYYEWPEDMLKPDVVIFLEVAEHLRQERHERRNTTNTKQEQLLKNDNEFRKKYIKLKYWSEILILCFVVCVKHTGICEILLF